VAPDGARWVPFLPRKALFAVAALGALAGVVGAWIFTESAKPAAGTAWTTATLTQVYPMDIALLLIGVGLGLVLGFVLLLSVTVVAK
jgi:hypothetical protein